MVKAAIREKIEINFCQLAQKRCREKRREENNGNSTLHVNDVTRKRLKETSTQVLSCEYCEVLRTPILKNICERMLLKDFPSKQILIR